MRRFSSGATRDEDATKPDLEGFMSPLVMKAYGEYMHRHRQQADGELRPSDNWQQGMPLDTYIKSAFRHFLDWWLEHRDLASRDGIMDALCGLLFNVMGYMHEVLWEKEAGGIQAEDFVYEGDPETRPHVPQREPPEPHFAEPMGTRLREERPGSSGV